MNEAIAWWREAAQRADVVRAQVDGLTRAGAPVSHALLAQLQQLETDVVARLEGVRVARTPMGPLH